MIDFNIYNEMGSLKKVVVGSAYDFGGVPELDECYDPKSIQHVIEGTFPKEECLIHEMNGFVEILEKYNIDVLRPVNIRGLNQIFVRDIAFVVNNKIVISNIISNREKEIQALEILFKGIDSKHIIRAPKEVRIEGGDVLLAEEYIFVGYSRINDFERYTVARTNEHAISFLQINFPNNIVKAFELNKSDDNPKENALHLDCCFQPIGKGMAILYPEGFKNKEDVDFLINHYGSNNIIYITRQEMYNMNANLFSISDNIIVSEKEFVRLNRLLRDKGFVVEEVKYSEVAKMEGLFRCSTMPLIRT